MGDCIAGLLSFHYVPNDFRAEFEKPWPIHEARFLAARNVHHRRRRLPRDHGANFRLLEYPARVRGSPNLPRLCFLLRRPRIPADTAKVRRGVECPRRRDPMKRRFCLTLDLKDDPALIAEYKRYHQRVWPEIVQSIKDSGIEDMEIYLRGTRMFMIMEVSESFSFEAKAKADSANPRVQQWEQLMWKFQQSLPQAKPGEKWLLMETIFKLED